MARRPVRKPQEIALSHARVGRYLSPESLEISSQDGPWRPPMDLFETNENIYLYAELPGMEEKKISIEIKDNCLNVAGERMFSARADETYTRVERAYGSFRRSFRLPVTVDEENIRAEFRLGVLKVTVPKLKQKRGKKRVIPVEKE